MYFSLSRNNAWFSFCFVHSIQLGKSARPSIAEDDMLFLAVLFFCSENNQACSVNKKCNSSYNDLAKQEAKTIKLIMQFMNSLGVINRNRSSIIAKLHEFFFAHFWHGVSQKEPEQSNSSSINIVYIFSGVIY